MSHAISVWHNWVLNRPPLSNPSNASNAPFESSCDMYSHYLQTPNFGRWKEDEIIKELQNIGVIPSTVTRWTKQLTEIQDKSAELSSRGSTLKRKDNRKSDELTDVVLSFGSCRVLQGKELFSILLAMTGRSLSGLAKCPGGDQAIPQCLQAGADKERHILSWTAKGRNHSWFLVSQS